MCCQSGRCWQFYSRSQPWCGLRLIKRVHQLRRLTLRRRTRPHRAGRRHTQLRHSVLVEAPTARSVPVQGARQIIVAQARSRIGREQEAAMRTALARAVPTDRVLAERMPVIVGLVDKRTGQERAAQIIAQVQERTRTIVEGRALTTVVQPVRIIALGRARIIAARRVLTIVAERMPTTVELVESVGVSPQG